jgi:RNA polymerase sigma-70 factor (ECF subfamily)
MDEQNTNIETLRLVGDALKGDQEAFSALYTRYAAGVYRLCYGLLLNAEDAEDVTQETFVYAFRNLARFDAAKASLKTWLYTIAVSRCRNMYRRRVFPLLDIAQLLHDVPAPLQDTPELRSAHRAATEAIGAAIADLSPQLREAVVLRYGHGLSYREIAEVMRCPAKTAESRVRLAHQQLRHLLQPHGQSLLEELLKA